MKVTDALETSQVLFVRVTCILCSKANRSWPPPTHFQELLSFMFYSSFLAVDLKGHMNPLKQYPHPCIYVCMCTPLGRKLVHFIKHQRILKLNEGQGHNLNKRSSTIFQGKEVDQMEPTWMSLEAMDYLHQEELETDVCNLYPRCSIRTLTVLYSNCLVTTQKKYLLDNYCAMIVLSISDTIGLHHDNCVGS